MIGLPSVFPQFDLSALLYKRLEQRRSCIQPKKIKKIQRAFIYGSLAKALL